MSLAAVLVVSLTSAAAASSEAAAGALTIPSLDESALIEGEWRFHAGDDPGWASPGFNDDTWPIVVVPKGLGAQGYKDLVGLYWMRLRVRAPAASTTSVAAATRQLSVQLWHVDSAYELYADGVKIGGRGSVDPPQVDDDAHAGVWPLPSTAFDDGEVVLAVRGQRSESRRSSSPARGGIMHGPNRIGPSAELQRGLVARDVGEWLLVGSFVVVGIYHMQLFRRRRALREYLWFGLFALFISLYSLTQIVLVQDVIGAEIINHFWFGSVSAAVVSFIEFIWPFLGRKVSRWLRTWQVAAIVWGVVGIAWPTPWFIHALLVPWEVVILLPFLVASTAIIAKRTLEGDPEARTIAAGTALMVLTAVNNILRTFGWQTPEITNYTFAIFVLSMAVSLSNRFTRVHDEVDALLVKTLRLSRMKDEILANTSHELRTPLNSIINLPRAVLEDLAPRPVIACSACDSLFEDADDADDAVSLDEPCPACAATGTLARAQRRVPPSDADGLAHKLEGVVASGEHLLGVVSDMLDTSKLAAGALELAKEDVRVVDVVSEVFARNAKLAREHAVTLAKDVASGAGGAALTVHADRERLDQIIDKLVDNAIKHSPKSAVVEVTARHDDDGALELRVIDRGPGVPAEEHAAIFEAFRKGGDGDGSHTRKHGGTGLGLSIARQLCELHGGSLSLESAPGAGATFIVRLPGQPR